MCLKIEEHALFVADSHYNQERFDFFDFLEQLKEQKIKTTQLFLMGDMFDFITQESHYFTQQNQGLIECINELSNTIQIIYLEGNHDYNLEKLFPHVMVIARQKQPLRASYQDQTVALSHGDNFEDWSYDLYCTVIRNRPLLKFLNAIDWNHWLSKRIDFALRGKEICRVYTGFEKKVKQRLEHYTADIIIEGHFHQGKEFLFDNKRYVNIPSLYCSKEYVVLHDNTFEKRVPH